MAFTSFKNISEVVKTYKLYYDTQIFIPALIDNARKPSAHLLETLDFNLNETVKRTPLSIFCLKNKKC